MNNTYTVKVGSPLLRPGLTIETNVSERYVKNAARKLIGMVREINADDKRPENAK
jgi:cell division protein FtsI/penicillin-binding protein 2